MGDGATFDWRDVLVYCAVTWALFCAAVYVGGLVYALTDPNIITFGAVTFLVVTATGGSLVAIACSAPVAWLLGRVLRTVGSGALHVGAFALLGGAAGFLVDRVGSFLLDIFVPWGQEEPTWGLTRGAIVTAVFAVSCATGRYFAWRAHREGTV